MGPPGIGKTQIMEQIASECGIGLVSYTITHHTRQSAVGLPMIKTEEFDGNEYSVTEYTMSEIIAGVYKAIKEQGHREGILLLMRLTVFLRHSFQLCCSSYSAKHLAIRKCRRAG